MFSKKRISDHYGQIIEDAVSRDGQGVKVRLIVASKPAQFATKKQDRQMKLPPWIRQPMAV
jgi:hypothetical protein